MCFFAFFGAKIWPAAAGPGELARDLRDQTPYQRHWQMAQATALPELPVPRLRVGYHATILHTTSAGGLELLTRLLLLVVT